MSVCTGFKPRNSGSRHHPVQHYITLFPTDSAWGRRGSPKYQDGGTGRGGMDSKQVKVHEARMMYVFGKSGEGPSRHRESIYYELCLCHSITGATLHWHSGSLLAPKTQNYQKSPLPISTDHKHHIPPLVGVFLYIKDQRHWWLLWWWVARGSQKIKQKQKKTPRRQLTMESAFALSPQQNPFSFIQGQNKLPSPSWVPSESWKSSFHQLRSFNWCGSWKY